jgi:hypothetical protein
LTELLKSNSRWILLLVGLASFPFFLKLGLDLDVVQRQGVYKLYREVRPEIMRIAQAQGAVKLVQGEVADPLTESFRELLSRDFKLVTVGDVPTLKLVFRRDQSLTMRTEIWVGENSKEPSRVLNSSTRLVNNGILLGPFAAFFARLLGLSLGGAFLLCATLVMFWWSSWNPLAWPALSLKWFSDSIVDLNAQITSGMSLTSLDPFRAFEISGALLLLVGAGTGLWFAKHPLTRKSALRKTMPAWALISFELALEAVLLVSVATLFKWDASVVKVFLGSLLFRYVRGAVYFDALLARSKRSPKVAKKSRAPFEHVGTAFGVSLIFIMSGLWDWLAALLAPGSSPTLLNLKIFLVSLVVGVVVPSRFFAILSLLLVLCWQLPPTQGYWASALIYGFAFEGIWLGTRLSLWMNEAKRLRLTSSFFAIVFQSWLLGIFLNAVGAPIGLCWLVLALAVWALQQLREGDSANSGDPVSVSR